MRKNKSIALLTAISVMSMMFSVPVFADDVTDVSVNQKTILQEKNGKFDESAKFSYDKSSGWMPDSDEDIEECLMTDEESIEDLLSQQDLHVGFRNRFNQVKKHIDSKSGNIKNDYLEGKNEEYRTSFKQGDEKSERSVSILSTSSLPDSVDLSGADETTGKTYFPAIRNQGSLGSCVSFAVAYYQFTYMANKLNNVAFSNGSTCYSPLYIYNMLGWEYDGSEYTDVGTGVVNNMLLLSKLGCAKLSEVPYSSSYYHKWDIDENIRINALKCRVSSYGSHTLATSTVPITSVNDDRLNTMKAYLQAGNVFTISTPAVVNFDKSYMYDEVHSGRKVVYRSYISSTTIEGHTMAVVGYDDTVWVDVNENGKKDIGESGAFKVANSHGNTNSGAMNAGYYWILYDAMNWESQIPDIEENSTTQIRVPIFAGDLIDKITGELNLSARNYYHTIKVKNYDVNVVTKVTANVVNRDDIRFDSILKYKDLYRKDGMCSTNSGNLSGTYTWILPADILLQRYTNSFNSLPVSYELGFQFESKDEYTDTEVKSYTYSLVDSNNNTIKSMTESSYELDAFITQTVNFKAGDVNYDEKISQDDAQATLQVALGTTDFSDLQNRLADINGNGKIEMDDAQAILNLSLGV